MGVDISFYRVKKKDYADHLKGAGLDRAGEVVDGGDVYDAWSTLLEFLEPREVATFCGRHFAYREVCDNIGTSDLMYPSESAVQRILDDARNVVSKWRMYNEELLQIPVETVRALVAEAVKAGETMVTIPLDDRSDYEGWVDDTDWHQASQFVEAERDLTDLTEDEEIVVVFSY